eukprot:UN19718
MRVSHNEVFVSFNVKNCDLYDLPPAVIRCSNVMTIAVFYENIVFPYLKIEEIYMLG